MPRISKSNPSGYVYCVRAKNAPEGPPFYTKIGSSSVSFEAKGGRHEIASFWISALGLGGLEYFEQPHDKAYDLEKLVHRNLKLSPGCGKSKEAFNISYMDAVATIEKLAKELE